MCFKGKSQLTLLLDKMCEPKPKMSKAIKQYPSPPIAPIMYFNQIALPVSDPPSYLSSDKKELFAGKHPEFDLSLAIG